MSIPNTCSAAEYIRMSTDSQELSPAIQKQAIREYAEAHAMTVVSTYEDGGRSGLTIKDRLEMKRLIRDVTRPERSFDAVLVYDISRWGRFQDTDASAYYEYHCRLHGVKVIYVKEPFSNDGLPLTALLKNLKRMMAAEYSRELKIKTRAGQEQAMLRGYQMGRLPCIGLRRMSVSSAGTPGRELRVGERKPMITDRVHWIHGPDHEVALVRRIFRMYTETNISIKGLVTLLQKEGLRDSAGHAFTHQILRALLRCEAFKGSFVWGRREDRTGLIRREGDEGFTRVRDVIAPIISPSTWELAQHKRRIGCNRRRSMQEALDELRIALEKNPRLAIHDLPGSGCPTEVVYRRFFGSFKEALRLAGKVGDFGKTERARRASRAQRLLSRFRNDLSALLRENDVPFARKTKSSTFANQKGARMAVQIVWQRQGRHGYVWWMRKDGLDTHYVLLVLMEDDESSKSFFLMDRRCYVHHPPWFTKPGEGAKVITSGDELLASMRQLEPLPKYVKVGEAFRRLRYVTPLPIEVIA